MALHVARKIIFLLVVGLLQIQPADAQKVGDMYKKCKYWELNGFPKKLELNKANLVAMQCNEAFNSYRISGKVNCQLSLNGLAGFVAPYDGYAFQVSSNKDLVSKFLLWAEENPRDWDKNLYAVLWKFTQPFKCSD